FFFFFCVLLRSSQGTGSPVAKSANCYVYGTLHGVLLKKGAVRKLFEIYSCQDGITPYNAPPLTRNNGEHAAGSAGFS
ncbi:hypothetical protein, partial [Escherichia coli]|uniref:hypothetical protein n=1 Tax=Escherichia coli TaxID=562 RepID=UPI001BAFF70C